jgi:hypothetical protein
MPRDIQASDMAVPSTGDTIRFTLAAGSTRISWSRASAVVADCERAPSGGHWRTPCLREAFGLARVAVVNCVRDQVDQHEFQPEDPVNA